MILMPVLKVELCRHCAEFADHCFCECWEAGEGCYQVRDNGSIIKWIGPVSYVYLCLSAYTLDDPLGYLRQLQNSK